MRMTYTNARRALSLSVVVAALLSGCGGDIAPSDDDAGVRPPDASHEPFDAGPGEDAGVPEDAAAPSDAPSSLDAPSLSDGGAAATDSGSILPPFDVGSPFADGGTLGDPEWVDLDVLTDGSHCTPLVPCGGDLLGTWDVTGGCFELPIESSLSMCPGARITRREGRARGRVTFDGTRGVRVAQSVVTVAMSIPAVCASYVGGCGAIEALVQRQAPDSTCLAQADGSCQCEARQGYAIDDGDAYRIEGNEFVSATTGHRWAYCVDGTSMRYEDVTRAPATREPGIIELGHR